MISFMTFAALLPFPMPLRPGTPATHSLAGLDCKGDLVPARSRLSRPPPYHGSGEVPCDGMGAVCVSSEEEHFLLDCW